jgi:hypothetical protein
MQACGKGWKILSIIELFQVHVKIRTTYLPENKMHTLSLHTTSDKVTANFSTYIFMGDPQ